MSIFRESASGPEYLVVKAKAVAPTNKVPDGLHKVYPPMTNHDDPERIARKVRDALATNGVQPVICNVETSAMGRAMDAVAALPCLHCGTNPRLSAEANFCSHCTAHGVGADPLVAQANVCAPTAASLTPNQIAKKAYDRLVGTPCLNCNVRPRLSGEANFCSTCAAAGCIIDNPPVSAGPAQIGTPSANEQANLWKKQAHALLGPTAKQETLDMVDKEIDQACATDQHVPQRAALKYQDYCVSYTLPAEAVKSMNDTVKEYLNQISLSLEYPEYKPRDFVILHPNVAKQYENLMANRPIDENLPLLPPCPFDVYGPGKIVEPWGAEDGIEELSLELFDDQVWDEALLKAEGREDRRHDVLEKMWEDAKYAAVRELCEAKATRIVRRR